MKSTTEINLLKPLEVKLYKTVKILFNNAIN